MSHYFGSDDKRFDAQAPTPWEQVRPHLSVLWRWKWVFFWCMVSISMTLWVNKHHDKAVPVAENVSHGGLLYSEQDVLCLAMNNFFESRSNSDKMEWYAMSAVIENRVEDSRYANTICDVVHEPAQFSWYGPHAIQMLKMANVIDQNAFANAYRAAQEFLEFYHSGHYIDITQGALNYHAESVSPKWAATMHRTAVFGSHIFYKP